MKVEAFVAESTAAVFRYYTEYRHLHRVAVFDWGGGTLDISVVEFRRSGIFEIGLGGTPTAGNTLDLEIAINLHARIMRERGQTRAFDEMDPHDQNELLFRSEEVKRRCLEPEVTLAMATYGGHPVHMEVSHAACARLLPAVTEAISLLETTIHRAGTFGRWCRHDPADWRLQPIVASEGGAGVGSALCRQIRLLSRPSGMLRTVPRCLAVSRAPTPWPKLWS